MSRQLDAWPQNWANYLGQSITIEGIALDAKLGALLAGDGPDIWIDSLDSWPAGFYLDGRQGKRVRVTGTVIERYDLPAFTSKEGDLPKTGMPVPPGADLQQASHRFLLRDANWVLVE